MFNVGKCICESECVNITVGVDDLKGIFQAKGFYDQQQIHREQKPAGKFKYMKAKVRATQCFFFNSFTILVGSFVDCRIDHI